MNIPIQAKATVAILGFVGKDPDIRTFSENFKVAELSVAVSKSFKNKEGNWEEKTSWFNCKAYNYIATRVEKYIRKGQIVTIFGDIEIESYTNTTGQNVSKTVINISSITPTMQIKDEQNSQTNDNDVPF